MDMIVTIFETLGIVVPVALFTWALKGQIDTMRAETKRWQERMAAARADLEREQAERNQGA